jgi:CHAT domain-containing protein/Tfp pilus assembly protein PilF
MWLQLDSRFARLMVVLLLGLVGAAAPTTVSSQGQTPPRGVVVEEVGKNFAGEKAGLKPGDLVLSWVRVAAPPANPEEARGEIGSPFDLAEIEVEQAPRGAVRLSGTRDGGSFSVLVPPGAWEITVRPQLAEPLLSAYQQGKELIAAKEIDKGVTGWRELAAQANKANDWKLAAWLFLRVGDTLTTARRRDEAHANYGVAIEALKDRGDSTLVARIWDAEGMAFERQTNFPKAEAAYREALQIRERISQETLAFATTLTNLGIVARNRGELTAAEDLHRRALAVREKLAPESLDVAMSLNSLGLVAEQRGDPTAAEELLKRALAIREKLAPESLDVAASLNNLGIMARNRDDMAGAEDLHKRALAIREKLAPNSLAVAGSLTNLGVVDRIRGDLAAAEEFSRRSLAIMEDLAPDSLTVATILNNLGIVARTRGDLVAAEEFYRRSSAIRDKLAPDSLDVAASLNSLGLVAFDRGDLAAAEEFYRRSLAIKEKLAPGSLDVAGTLNNLGLVAFNRGDLAAAEELYRRSLVIREKLAPNSLSIAASLNNLGIVAFDRGDLAAAEDSFRRSLAIKDKLAPGNLNVAETLNHLGNVAKERGDGAAADRSYRTALALWQKLAPGTTGEAEVLYNLGLLERRAVHNDAAADYLQRAIAAVEAQTGRLGGADEVRSGFAAQYSAYYRDYVGLLLELNQPAEAFHVLERSRARSLLAMLAERDLVFAADLPADLARERTLMNADYDRTQSAIARLNPARDGVEIDRLLARLRELRDKREEIVQTIRKGSPRFASLLYPQPLDLGSAQRSLDAGTVLLAYSVTKDKTFLFVVQPSGRPLVPAAPPVSVFTLAIGETVLREKVAAFRRLIQRDVESDRGSTVPLIAAGQDLYETLVKPAHALIAASDRVLISADGPLHTLPFAVLVQPSDRSARGLHRYFIEWKPLHVVASATVYAELKKARRDTGDAPPSVVLAAFGDPKYPALAPEQADRIANPDVRAAVRRGYALEPLPASRTEVERIARLYAGRATTYLGNQATEEHAKAIGKGVRYLHFASHGLLDERFPLNSSLALTIPERPAEGQANGLLQAWEIFEQMRIDADLVTLSACETGLGKELGGEGLVGLTRAFQYAGAHSVLASLWSVGDDSTAELMTRFYGYLKAGKTKDNALRSAQIELIRTRRTSSRPFHWAAFQLIGDWK